MSKILLIDGLNMIWRSNISFGAPKSGVPYNVVYNFLRSLRATIEQFSPDKVFFCLEGKDNFRYALLPEYKANRIVKRASLNQDKSDDFNRQRDIVIDLIKHLPISISYAAKYEADDVIATLCYNLEDEEEIVILSTDTDFIQLLQGKQKNIKLYNPSKKELVSPPDYHYLGWKILRGDKKTDNIPGIVSDEEAVRLITNPEALTEFLLSDENKSAFNLNKSLIELSIVPEDELIIEENKLDLTVLHSELEKMEFNTMLTDKYWNSFKTTFETLCSN